MPEPRRRLRRQRRRRAPDPRRRRRPGGLIPPTPAAGHEDLLRRLAPQVLGAVVRRYGHFDAAEDAVQHALLAGASQWPEDGVPGDPRAWLITVASRRLIDLLRQEQARRRREDMVARRAVPDQDLAPSADGPRDGDDTLIVLFMCCHPALSPASQIALTLRAVGGLTAGEIARAFLVPEATMTRRITRAKHRIRDSGIPFALPAGAALGERLAAVLHVLYLIFNEGYASTARQHRLRTDLSGEAIRLARMVHGLLPDDPEVTGLLALMVLTDARRPARTGARGEIVPMAEQDRGLWDAALVAEGVRLLTDALGRGHTGPYQVQAAIAALHDEAPSAEATDWPQILALYELLREHDGNPVVALNHAVAVAMVRGPAAGLDLLEGLRADDRLAHDHRLPAVRARMLEMAGDHPAARAAYREAIQRTTNDAVRRHLRDRVARLADGRR
ncbi:MAG TPA: DUF6596 domain-containing protein [Acidimicrobiales bacterium]|nr:DUF6596 domain-containing protein [Acidimicrobiales bacterium]